MSGLMIPALAAQKNAAADPARWEPVIRRATCTISRMSIAAVINTARRKGRLSRSNKRRLSRNGRRSLSGRMVPCANGANIMVTKS